jgi:xanthine dehydrogenase iron-sulfur cluster and FAD-binding subunit A
MILDDDLQLRPGFFSGFGRVLEIGAARMPAPAYASLADDALALIGDWNALGGDQMRALDRLTGELATARHGAE